MKTYKIYITTEKDDYDDIVYSELTGEDDSIKYCVSNLNECPEDAIIGRSLFDTLDYVEALRIGMALAKDGYTDIEVIETINE